MDFDFTTETITPDATTILTIGGTGALELPSGTTAQEPGGAVAGAIRYNTTVPQLEYYTGAAWVSFTGSVTSVSGSGGTTGLTLGGGPITTSGTLTLGGTLVVGNGGTGATTLTANGVLLGNGTSAISATAVGATGQVLVGNTAAAPTWTSTPAISGANITATTIPNSALVNSSITVTGGTGLGVAGSPVSLGGTVTLSNTGVTSITGTVNQVIASSATGAVTLSLPQNINTTATPTFNQITITNAPVAATDTVNLSYLQAVIAGLEWKQEAQAATTADLGSVTYANGASGVGATLTNAGTQVAFAVDGYTASSGDRILVKNQATPLQNGIYTVTTVGSGSTNWVLTRAIDSNTSADLNNATLYITNGTSNKNTAWTQTTANPTVGTSNIVFVQNSGTGTYVAGTGLTLTSNTFSLTSPVVATLGGTGTVTAPTAGQLLVGTSGGAYVPYTITSGTGISTTTGSGTFQINNTGVTSITGTANQITASASTGAVTLSLPASVTITTALTISGLTANSFLYSGTAGLLTTTAAPTNGQLLIGSTGAAPVAAALTGGTDISITNGAGSITVNHTAVGTAGTYGQVTTDAQGHVSSGQVVADPAHGGTGASTTPTNGQILVGNGTNYTVATLASGTGISTTVGAGTLQINNTGVLSFSAGTTGLTPNTATTGAVTLAGTLVLANGGTSASLTATNGGIVYSTAAAMAITAAGTSGQFLVSAGAAAPVWTTITNGGLKLYSENPSTPTAPSATGTNAVAIGTGSAASGTNTIGIGSGTSAVNFGNMAFANGDFATAGDSQALQANYRVLTSSNATVEMFLDGSGASQRMVLPNNSAWTFQVKIICRRTDATGTYGSWIFSGMIYRDATAATTTISGTSKTTIARIGGIVGANDPVLSADTTNGSLKIVVTGTTGDTIRWVANAQLVQVTN